jgi:hypothetical protein
MLFVVIDDATGRLPALRFALVESAQDDPATVASEAALAPR